MKPDVYAKISSQENVGFDLGQSIRLVTTNKAQELVHLVDLRLLETVLKSTGEKLKVLLAQNPLNRGDKVGSHVLSLFNAQNHRLMGGPRASVGSEDLVKGILTYQQEVVAPHRGVEGRHLFINHDGLNVNRATVECAATGPTYYCIREGREVFSEIATVQDSEQPIVIAQNYRFAGHLKTLPQALKLLDASPDRKPESTSSSARILNWFSSLSF